MFLSVENIKTLHSEKYISEEAFEKEFKFRPEKGDVLMTRIGDIGTANVVETDGPIAYYVSLALLKQKQLNPYFLQASIHSPSMQKEIWRRTLHIAFPKKINKNEVANVPIKIPSHKEQEDIGTFFQNLDHTITLHLEKLYKLRRIKKGLLQLMFPQNGETEPRLRFTGFVSSWEQRKLGELIEEHVEVVPGTTDIPVATSSRKGLFLQNEYFKGDRTGIDESVDFHLVPKEYITYRHMSDDSIFHFNQNDLGTDVLVSQEYPVFKSNDLSDQRFILAHLNNAPLFLNFSRMQKKGGTRVRLYIKVLKEYGLKVPSIEEQQKIGTIFQNIDHLIALHHERIDKLKKLKKAYLQLMFI